MVSCPTVFSSLLLYAPKAEVGTQDATLTCCGLTCAK